MPLQLLMWFPPAQSVVGRSMCWKRRFLENTLRFNMNKNASAWSASPSGIFPLRFMWLFHFAVVKISECCAELCDVSWHFMFTVRDKWPWCGLWYNNRVWCIGPSGQNHVMWCLSMSLNRMLSLGISWFYTMHTFATYIQYWENKCIVFAYIVMHKYET